MVYLRPPKKMGGYNIPPFNPLAFKRGNIVKAWTAHGMTEHEWASYPLVGRGAMIVLSCAECKDYRLKLYETERGDND